MKAWKFAETLLSDKSGDSDKTENCQECPEHQSSIAPSPMCAYPEIDRFDAVETFFGS